MENGAAQPFHALVLPFPTQGHLTPFLHFSQLLLRSSNTLLTFLNTQHNHLLCLANSPSSTRIRFLLIPDGLPPHAPASPDGSFQAFLMHLEGLRKQQDLLEDIIIASTSTTSPISCIISDSLLPWTQVLANKLQIKRVNFWTSNATSLYTTQLFASQKIDFSGDKARVIGGSDVDIVSLVDKEIVPMYVMYNKRVKADCEGIEEAACTVVRTFRRLEGPILEAMPLSVRVTCCAPFSALPVEGEEESMDEEALECLRWLDLQEASSVLYIAFGSVASLAAEEMEELALGLEASRQPFLWVVRHDNTRDMITQEMLERFVERSGGRGMVVRWAPQRHVLGHGAVGGFLTHCGWNSTVESVAMGVPMLCWPMFYDQPLTSLLIQKVWKVGMALPKGKGGVMDRKEVEKMVLRLLLGDEGKVLRQCALDLADDIAKDIMNEETGIPEFLQALSKENMAYYNVNL